MIEILNTVLPVFGLVVLGFLSIKSGFIRKGSAEGLSQYVFSIAIPTLLFRTMVEVNPPEQAPWGLWVAFFGAVLVIWTLMPLLARLLDKLPGDEAPAAGMASSFGNLLMLGLPIVYGHYGANGTLVAALIISIHAPLQWLGATLIMEWHKRAGSVNYRELFSGLLRDLIRNPIVMALVIGSAWRFTGLGLTPAVNSMVQMLAQSSVPAALVALGFSLASLPIRGQISAAFLIVGLKMLVMPALVGLAGYLIGLPPLWLAVAIVFASIPPGANAYLFANRYNAAVAPVAASIAIGTAIAAFTMPILLWCLDHFLL